MAVDKRAGPVFEIFIVPGENFRILFIIVQIKNIGYDVKFPLVSILDGSGHTDGHFINLFEIASSCFRPSISQVSLNGHQPMMAG